MARDFSNFISRKLRNYDRKIDFLYNDLRRTDKPLGCFLRISKYLPMQAWHDVAKSYLCLGLENQILNNLISQQ